MILIFCSWILIQIALNGGGVPDNFILFTDTRKHAVYRMDITTKSSVSIPVTNISNPIAIDYDYIENRIVWTDVGLMEIRSIYMNGTHEKSIRKVPDSILDGLAVDAESRLVFYTDKGRHEIVKMKIDGTVAKVLFRSSVQKPRAIEVDSSRRKLYWTDWGETAKIESANYDGTNRKLIVGTGLVFPNGIALDHEGEIIYWCDAATGKIEKSDTDGTNRQLVHSASGVHYFGIALYRDTLFYTDWNNRRIMSISTSGGAVTSIGSSTFGRLNDIHVYAKTDECMSSPCQNGATCTDNVNGYHCNCAPGFIGFQCNTETDECKSSPCENNGSCIDVINGYSCTCDLGYIGVRCEIDIDECRSSPCQHDANCSDGVNNYACTCKKGFDGINCENDIDDCIPDPCRNGANCTDGTNSYNCTCLSGFFGVNCQNETTVDNSSSQTGNNCFIIGLIIGTVLATICLIIGAVVLIKRTGFTAFKANDTSSHVKKDQDSEVQDDAVYVNQIYMDENRPSPSEDVETAEGYYANLSQCSRQESNVYDTLNE